MEHWEESGPVPGHTAFRRNDPMAVHSQAAFLLALAYQAWRRRPIPQSRFPSDSLAEGERGVDPEDAELLDLPDWPHPLFRADLTVARMRLLERFAETNADLQSPKIAQGSESQLAKALYDNPSAEAALNLIQACLYAQHPLVSVAAAAADLRLDLLCHDLLASRLPFRQTSILTLDPLVLVGAAADLAAVDHPDDFAAPARVPLANQSIEVLMRGAGAQHELVRDVAMAALEGARFYFESRNPQRARPEESSSDDVPSPRPSRTSVLVHGTTFGRSTSWWKPGRVFPKYLKANVSHNLYSGSKPFYWSGLYNHRARVLGADDLVQWASAYTLDHVYAYSHGGSVAMLASDLGLSISKLVLLSCPVHSHYAPNFQRVRKVVSVRTRLDLVILADLGGQRFRDPKITERVLPIWFTHNATRQPDVWRRHRIDAML